MISDAGWPPARWGEVRVTSFTLRLHPNKKKHTPLLFSEAATNRRSGAREKRLLFVDARKAYFNAYVDRPTYVDRPQEGGMPGHCGRLQRCMYGTKKAATLWEET